MPPVTLCVINHNGAAHLQEALAAVAEFADQFDELLVIDNASTDDSVACANSFDRVSVRRLPANEGPAGARNAGFELARNDLILFQDNDICLAPGTAAALSRALLGSERVLIAAPRVVYKDRPDLIQYDGADCHVLGLMAPRHADVRLGDAPAGVHATSSLVTACFMIHRRRWEGGPVFDERLEFNLEDHDLGVRANLLGYGILATTETVVSHGTGTPGLSFRPGYAVSSRRMFCLVRNRWWIVIRYFSTLNLVKLAPMLLLFEGGQLAGLICKGFFPAWLRAWGSTLRHLPRLVSQRRGYQRRRRKPDAEILKLTPLPLTSALVSGPAAARAVQVFEATLRGYVRWALPELSKP